MFPAPERLRIRRAVLPLWSAYRHAVVMIESSLATRTGFIFWF
jgi:hypothetical protein